MAIDEHEATYISGQETAAEQFSALSKQENDFVFAACLISSGYLNESELARVLDQWTIHGNEPLGRFLVRVGAISESERAAIDRQMVDVVNHQLSKIGATPHSEKANHVTIGAPLVESIDASGKLSRILGYHLERSKEDTKDLRLVQGRYRLVRKLGQGGLGTVWLARDEMLKRFVAIKEIRKGMHQASAAVSRFQREAELTGRLEHPSIVPIYQFGMDERHEHQFYVMRFLGKQTLQDAIAEYHERVNANEDTRLTLHNLLNAFTNICQAIAYAHSRSVIHRDLKPENIALDAYGQVIVLDWGLAKLIGEEGLLENSDATIDGLGSGQSTVAGQVLGTPMFMAPEQASGRHDEIDERTDIYGLGAILFAILTGSPPHRAERASSQQTAGRLANVLSAIVSKPTPRARERLSTVAPELDAICAKAMAKKRYNRYQTASELADDVQRYLAGEMISAYREPFRKRAQRWIATHRRFPQFTAVLLTGLFVVSVNGYISSRRNSITERQTRFETLRGEARQLADNLKNPTRSLIRNARFMAGTPPVQGIINARAGREGDGEAESIKQLNVIYSGLLGANPEYTTVWLVSVNKLFEVVDEIARLESSQLDVSNIRILPPSRLRSYPLGPHKKAAFGLKPGDVYVTDQEVMDEVIEVAPVENLSRPDQTVRLSAMIPVFDQVDGETFGAVGIDLDLDRIFKEEVVAMVKASKTVILVDSKGLIRQSYSIEGGFTTHLNGKPLTAASPKLANFLKPDGLAIQESDQETFFAKRVELDETGRAVFGLVMLLDD